MSDAINFEEDLKVLRRVLFEYPKLYKSNEEALREIHQEATDYRHIIELVSFNAFEGYNFAKMYQDNLKKRRELKNENELLEKIVELVKNSNIKENKVNQVLGDIRNISNTQDKRHYTMKIRKDLQNMFDQKTVFKGKKEG